MARIDIRDLDDETLKQIDEQCQRYGINNRSDYIRMLIKLDIMTNIVDIIRHLENKPNEETNK
jgi:metal-responsive CopG/Arc/MetJ family transcriptional regulator